MRDTFAPDTTAIEAIETRRWPHCYMDSVGVRQRYEDRWLTLTEEDRRRRGYSARARPDLYAFTNWLHDREWRKGDGMVGDRILALFDQIFSKPGCGDNWGLNPYHLLDYRQGEDAEKCLLPVLKKIEQLAQYFGGDS